MRTPTFKAVRMFLAALAAALLVLPVQALAAGEAVTVAVIGPDAGGEPVYYAPAAEVVLPEDGDAWTASAAVMDAAGLAYEADSSSYGVFLSSVTSPVDGTALAYDDESGRYWQLFVDGAVSEVGISDVEVADGTQIVWFYSAFGDELPAHVGTVQGAGADAPDSAQAPSVSGLAVAGAVVAAVVVGGALYMRRRNAA